MRLCQEYPDNCTDGRKRCPLFDVCDCKTVNDIPNYDDLEGASEDGEDEEGQ